jgi:hypothetical protein
VVRTVRRIARTVLGVGVIAVGALIAAGLVAAGLVANSYRGDGTFVIAPQQAESIAKGQLTRLGNDWTPVSAEFLPSTDHINGNSWFYCSSLSSLPGRLAPAQLLCPPPPAWRVRLRGTVRGKQEAATVLVYAPSAGIGNIHLDPPL